MSESSALQQLKEKLYRALKDKAILGERSKLLAQQVNDARKREDQTDYLVSELVERQRELNYMLHRANTVLHRFQETNAVLSAEFTELVKELPDPQTPDWEQRVSKINDLFRKTGDMASEVQDEIFRKGITEKPPSERHAPRPTPKMETAVKGSPSVEAEPVVRQPRPIKPVFETLDEDETLAASQVAPEPTVQPETGSQTVEEQPLPIVGVGGLFEEEQVEVEQNIGEEAEKEPGVSRLKSIKGRLFSKLQRKSKPESLEDLAAEAPIEEQKPGLFSRMRQIIPSRADTTKGVEEGIPESQQAKPILLEGTGEPREIPVGSENLDFEKLEAEEPEYQPPKAAYEMLDDDLGDFEVIPPKGITLKADEPEEPEYYEEAVAQSVDELLDIQTAETYPIDKAYAAEIEPEIISHEVEEPAAPAEDFFAPVEEDQIEAEQMIEELAAEAPTEERAPGLLSRLRHRIGSRRKSDTPDELLTLPDEAPDFLPPVPALFEEETGEPREIAVEAPKAEEYEEPEPQPVQAGSELLDFTPGEFEPIPMGVIPEAEEHEEPETLPIEEPIEAEAEEAIALETAEAPAAVPEIIGTGADPLWRRIKVKVGEERYRRAEEAIERAHAKRERRANSQLPK